MKAIFAIMFWVVVIAAPLGTCALIVVQIPEASSIPLYWTLGEVERWGSSDDLAKTPWLVGGIVSILNILMAIGYAFGDQLHKAGITNGVPSDSIRPILVICAIIVTTIACVTLFSATTMIDASL